MVIKSKSTIKIIPNKNLGMKNSFELMQSIFVNVGKGTGATIVSAAGGMQYAQERGDLKMAYSPTASHWPKNEL